MRYALEIEIRLYRNMGNISGYMEDFFNNNTNHNVQHSTKFE